MMKRNKTTVREDVKYMTCFQIPQSISTPPQSWSRTPIGMDLGGQTALDDEVVQAAAAVDTRVG
jgi:hypothetical protein